MKKINWTGKRVGRMTVIRETDMRREKCVVWECLCDCGKTTYTGANQMKEKHSCGCYLKDTATVKGRNQRTYSDATINEAYRGHKQSAKARNTPPLSKEEWERIAELPCFYCGEMDTRNVVASKRGQNQRAIPMSDEELKLYEVKLNGIDRVNSSKGYEPENCVPCCKMCNWMKNGFKVLSFIRKIKQISAHITEEDVIKLDLGEDDLDPDALYSNSNKKGSAFR